MAETMHSPIVTYASMLSLLTLCPSFVILLLRSNKRFNLVYVFQVLKPVGNILIHCMRFLDGSVVQTSGFLWENGVQGLVNIWPRPTAIAWKIIFCYGAFEAALQLLLPGKRVEGPDNGLAAYFVTLATYLGLWWFGIFNPAIVYDHSGEIFIPANHISILKSQGMELYPRIGKNFDIKVFTNCRFGMMSLAVLAVTYCIKQYEINGRVSDSMLVNTILMLVYVTKFFLWEAGYWNSMDIAHDRGGDWLDISIMFLRS
ncbi:hypothetical protein Bca101_043635 [Brassica carinata]